MNEHIKKTVIDRDNKVHTLAKTIGAGGQGKVIQTTVPSIAIKLTIDPNTQKEIDDPDSVYAYQEQIEKIKALPIPHDIAITIPIVVLENSMGYVMDMLPDMCSWKEAFMLQRYVTPSSEWPAFYQDLLDSEDLTCLNLWVAYTKTGSAKQRFLCLYHVAVLLQELHGRGILFGDLSDNNVYINKQTLSNIWLIDADNLRFDRKKLPKGTGVYTPGFGAPELFWEPTAVHIESDCHAFAVLAFQTLTDTHPFLDGPVITEYDGNDWENPTIPDIDQTVNAGDIPWIGDLQNLENNYTGLLERDNILSSDLHELFDKTFTDGRLEPWKRPSIFHWSKSLLKAHDRHVLCGTCHMSFDVVKHQICCWCDAPAPSHLRISSFFTVDNSPSETINHAPKWIFIHKDARPESSTCLLPLRILEPFSATTANESVIQIKCNQDSLRLQKKTHHTITIQKRRRRGNKLPSSKMGSGVHTVKYSQPITLYVPSTNRLITVEVIGGSDAID